MREGQTITMVSANAKEGARSVIIGVVNRAIGRYFIVATSDAIAAQLGFFDGFWNTQRGDFLVAIGVFFALNVVLSMRPDALLIHALVAVGYMIVRSVFRSSKRKRIAQKLDPWVAEIMRKA